MSKHLLKNERMHTCCASGFMVPRNPVLIKNTPPGRDGRLGLLTREYYCHYLYLVLLDRTILPCGRFGRLLVASLQITNVLLIKKYPREKSLRGIGVRAATKLSLQRISGTLIDARRISITTVMALQLNGTSSAS